MIRFNSVTKESFNVIITLAFVECSSYAGGFTAISFKLIKNNIVMKDERVQVGSVYPRNNNSIIILVGSLVIKSCDFNDYYASNLKGRKIMLAYLTLT